MKENTELNFLDKFLYKFLICLILLIVLLTLGKYNVINLDKVKGELSENINILKIFKFINGEKGIFVPIEITDEVTDTVSKTYENYEEIAGGKRIFVNAMSGVEVYKTGIIIKIYQNKDNTFQVTVKGIDGYEYVYDKLETVDYNIYTIVKSGDILGLPITQNNKTYFEFYVNKNL